MHRYHILSDEQMERLLEAAPQQEGAGFLDVDGALKLEQMTKLNNDIKRVLSEPENAETFEKFRSLHQQLQTLYQWFKTRELERKDDLFAPLAALPGPRARYAELPVEQPQPKLTKRIKTGAVLKPKEKLRRVQKRNIVLEPEVFSPRRPRSKGKPAQWRNLDAARDLYPRLRRI